MGEATARSKAPAATQVRVPAPASEPARPAPAPGLAFALELSRRAGNRAVSALARAWPVPWTAQRAALAADAIVLARVFSLDLEEVEFRLDARIEGRARAKQQGRVVYLRPDLYDPSSYTGRYLLAHELVHVAQRRLPARDLPLLDAVVAAEVEAEAIGRAFALGAAIDRPRVALPGAAPAYDDPDREALEDRLLQSPPAFKRTGVSPAGIQYAPAGAFDWPGGMNKTLLGCAITVLNLVGPSAYKPALVRAYITDTGGLASIEEESSLSGRAVQGEKAIPFLVRNPLAYQFAVWLSSPPRNLKLTLSAAQLEALRAGVEALETFDDIRESLYAWCTRHIYMGVAAIGHVTLLHRYADALRLDRANGTLETMTAASKAKNALLDAIRPPMDALDAIRRDTKLVDHPAYRSIWNLPAKQEGEAPGAYVVGEDSTPDESLAVQLLWAVQNEPDRSVAARAIHGPNHDDRRQLLDWFSKRAGLRAIALGGDVLVGDRLAKATMPPLASKLKVYPQLEAPFFDLPKGSDRTFTMSVWFPDIFEAWPGNYRYHFEILAIPNEQIEKLQQTADDLERRGESPGMGSLLGQRLSRDIEYGKTDIARSIWSLSNILGPPGIGATSLAAVGAMLRLVGTVIKTFIERITKPDYEKTLPFGDVGLFVVRCIAWPTAANDKDTVITRAQSVAWLPLWVRPAEAMSKLRVATDEKQRSGAMDRLKEIEGELKALDPKDKDYDKKKKDLEDERARLQTSLYGEGDKILELERKALEEQKGKVVAGSYEEKAILKRIDEIDEILKMRAKRLADVPAKEKGLEPPFRFTSAFVGDTGQTIRCLMEAYQVDLSGKTFRYHVIDSTTRNSGNRDGTGASRVEAILDAVRTILESGEGYGRGYVTVRIPDTMYAKSSAPGETGVERTLRIEADSGQVMIEALENAALVASIAAVAAAPFTGGASLELLIPIAVVGAIPSAYRLIERADQGTLRLDMATVMDIVNIVGAAVGVAQYTAGVRAAAKGIQVGTGWMLLGLGNDGLGFAVMGAGFIEEIEETLDADPNMPEGVKRARIMQAVGNQLVNLGIMVGAHLAAEAKPMLDAYGKGGQGPEVVHPRADAALETHFREAVGPAGKDIPVFRDTEGTRVKGNGVEIHYELDGYGLPTDLKVIMGPNAGLGELDVHARTAQAMLKYQGVSGYLRTLLDRLVTWFHGKPEPKHGSRAWEAKLELEKLPREIDRVMRGMQDGTIRPEDGETYVKHLQEQMKIHEGALDELEAGQGFIAAQAPVGADAVKHGYPQPPPDHFYVERGDGTFELRRHVGSDAPPFKIVFEEGKPKVVPDKGVPRPEIPKVEAGKPPPPPMEAPRVRRGPDPARLRADVARALKAAPHELAIHSDAKFEHVSVRPVPGGGYEVHFKPGTPEPKIMAAVERHRQLASRRPADPKTKPYDVNGRRWSGADEAVYLGRPDAEPGYHWALHEGELRYVRDDAANAETPKKVYDEKLGQFVVDTGERVEERFAKGTKPEDAFELLGGNDPNSEFGAWVETVQKELGVKVLDELKARFPDPGADQLTHRHVRHTVKEPITRKLVDRLVRMKDKQLSHQRMLELTEHLGSADRGSIAEQWYVGVYGTKDTTTHPKLEKAKLANPKPGYDKVELSKDRVPDLVESGKLKDVKDVRGPLGDRDLEQAGEFELLVGKRIEIEGKPVDVREMVTVFPEPEGAAANAQYIVDRLRQSRVNQSFEIFTADGSHVTLTRADVLTKTRFNPAGGPKGLLKALQALAK